MEGFSRTASTFQVAVLRTPLLTAPMQHHQGPNPLFSAHVDVLQASLDEEMSMLKLVEGYTAAPTPVA